MPRSVAWFILMIALFFAFEDPVHASPDPKTILSVKSSPNAVRETQMIVNDRLARMIRKGVHKTAHALPVSDAYLTLRDKNAHQTFVVDDKGNLYNLMNHEMIQPSVGVKSALLKHCIALRAQHYGKIVPWDKATGLMPKQMKFKVIDLETGLSFNVQRRAGNRHADVQPLSKEDTAVMKQIYNGKWSWQRKAILVEFGDQLLAASMNGMPHGGDGIPHNGFKGHFCIHFLGSSTHRTRHTDPEHQLMVRKAAGTLGAYLDHASPYEVADTFIHALSLKEPQILKMSLGQADHPQLPTFLQLQERISAIRESSPPVEKDASRLLTLEIPVKVSIHLNGQRGETSTYLFQMTRTGLSEPWKIDRIDIKSPRVKIIR